MKWEKGSNTVNTKDFPLTWEGIERCQFATFGALHYLIQSILEGLDGIGDSAIVHGLYFPVWMLRDHLDDLESYLDRFGQAMSDQKISLEPKQEGGE